VPLFERPDSGHPGVTARVVRSVPHCVDTALSTIGGRKPAAERLPRPTNPAAYRRQGGVGETRQTTSRQRDTRRPALRKAVVVAASRPATATCESCASSLPAAGPSRPGRQILRPRRPATNGVGPTDPCGWRRSASRWAGSLVPLTTEAPLGQHPADLNHVLVVELGAPPSLGHPVLWVLTPGRMFLRRREGHH
jgi:hypothetical protein